MKNSSIPHDALPTLAEMTTAVRDVLLQSGPAPLYGCCIPACLILGWILKGRGYPSEMWSCSPEGWPHWCVRSGEWILDPTAGQFGDVDSPLLLFREGSPDHWYDPGKEEPFAICEREIIEQFARWIELDADPDAPEELAGRSSAIPGLLQLAGLEHLDATVQRAGAHAIANHTHAKAQEQKISKIERRLRDDDSAAGRLMRAGAELEHCHQPLIDALERGLDAGVIKARFAAFQAALRNAQAEEQISRPSRSRPTGSPPPG
jgi:hypothetical protein